MIHYTFCSECLGIFESRAYGGVGNFSNNFESCIFCGATAQSETDPNRLKPVVLEALHKKMLASKEVKKIQSVLLQLQQKKIPISIAENQIEAISPGLGSKICGVIRRHGLKTIGMFGAALTVYVQFAAVQVSRESNAIALKSLELAVEQSHPIDKLPESKPSRGQVHNAHPQRAVDKNRKARRAEQAKKRRKK